MNISELIKKLRESEENEDLYLLEKLSDMAGYFVSKSHLIYFVKNTETNECKKMETEFLELNTNIPIISISNAPTFESGNYNLLTFKKDKNENELESFIELCNAHSEYMKSKEFINFFYSLINIFQIPTEEKHKNIIGLVGELFVMIFFYNKFEIDISPFWHKSGSSSKYDFVFKSFNLEIKTTCSEENLYCIKHRQIFNEERNVLGAVKLIESEQGKSLNELIKELKEYKNAFHNFNFILNLQQELRKVTKEDIEHKKFELIDINFYYAEKINPFPDISNNIYNLSYQIDLTDEETILNDELSTLINCN